MAEGADAAATTGTTAPEADEVRGWLGNRLDEIGGASVARIDGFYVDERTGRPEWLVVRLGTFGHTPSSRRARRLRRPATSGFRTRGTPSSGRRERT